MIETPTITVSEILWSYWYNRDVDELISLCDELIERLNGNFPDWTDDGNIIYGIIIHTWGNYGTSPRAGWFEPKYEFMKDKCIEEINEFKQEMINVKEREE